MKQNCKSEISPVSSQFMHLKIKENPNQCFTVKTDACEAFILGQTAMEAFWQIAGDTDTLMRYTLLICFSIKSNKIKTAVKTDPGVLGFTHTVPKRTYYLAHTSWVRKLRDHLKNWSGMQS